MLTITVMALLAGAQEPDCRNPQAQQDMNYCAAEDARRADERLNRLWPQVVARVQAADRDNETRGEGERRLRAAQRAWIAFRDAQCSLDGLEALGGSLEPLLIEGCRKRMTERRIAELTEVLRPR